MGSLSQRQEPLLAEQICGIQPKNIKGVKEAPLMVERIRQINKYSAQTEKDTKWTQQ